MLSAENPPPVPDPNPCCLLLKTTTTNTNTTHDQKRITRITSSSTSSSSSSSSHLFRRPIFCTVSQQLAPLSSSDVPDHHDTTDTPLLIPNFSIRDYVFSARTKDIKTSWPFSEKNLQLCLKHGVNNLLPPFKSRDLTKTCPLRTTLSKQTQNIGNSDKIPSGTTNHLRPSSSGHATWKPKEVAASSHLDVNSCRIEKETNLLLSTITSNSQADIESVPTNRISTSPIQTATNPLEAQVVGGQLVPSSKIVKTTPSSSKKCRLIVKFSTISNPSSTEDIASNSTILSEAMTSIVCPVCKIFSSSSNTTLNAHIDQCLSVESTSNWMPDSRFTSKYKIKPRRMRSMVDIIATAPRCTLEELDRRNGSSWATGSALPNQHADQVRAQGKKRRTSPVCPDDAADEGEVYFDANGTKLRILSKFNIGSSVSEVGENSRQREALKEGETRSKFFSTNKKKHRAVKHQKYLNLTLQSKNLSSPEVHSPQIHGGQDGDCGLQEGCSKEGHLTQVVGAQGHMKPIDSGTLRQWARSKRTGLSKKIKKKDNHQHSGCKLHMAQDLLIENDQSDLGDSNALGSHPQRFLNSLQKPIACKNNQTMGSSFCGTQIDNASKHSIPRKQVSGSPVGDQMGENVERSCEPLSQNSFQLSKDSTSMHDSFPSRPLKCKKDHASSLSRKKPKLIAGPVKSSGDSPNVSTYPSRGCQAFLSKGIRFSTLKKKVFTLSQSSVPEAKFSSQSKKNSTLKKSQVRCTEEIDEDVAAWPSQMDEDYDSMHNHTENKIGEEIANKGSLGRSSVQKIRNKRGVSQMGKSVVGRDINSSVRISDDFSGKFDSLESARRESQFCGQDVVTEQSLKMAAGGTIMGSSKSLQPEYEKLDYSCDTRSTSVQSVEEHKGDLCEAESPVSSADPSLGDGREMFCANGADDGVVGHKAHMGVEMGFKVTQGNNFPEIDPIPIPGPPGSFLPSPRGMGSEDFQGNSSVTTSRINSSQDQHFYVDGDSSNSPISATSTVSNSTAARSDRNCSEELLSVAFHAVKDKIQYDFSGARVEALVENVATGLQTTNTCSDRSIPDVKSLKVNVISPKSGPLKLKDDNQPCCCSRKERFSQGIALNDQESQLLRRRNMASLPSTAKQIGCFPNTTPEVFCFSNSPNSGAEKGLLPVLNSSAGPSPLKSSFGTTVKFPSSGDSDSASPSASTPILRLMGKNLMVVSKDEDSAHLRESQAGSPNDRSNPQFLNFSGASPGNIQNWDYRSSRDHRVPQDSVNVDQGFRNTVEQCFDARFSNGFRSHINSATRLAPTQAQASMLPGKQIGSNLESLELHEYKGQCNYPSQMCRRKNGLDAASIYHEKVIRTPISQCRHGDFVVNPTKEVVVIDDAVESEAGFSTGDFKYPKGLMGSHLSPGGISIPAGPDCSSRHVNPYSCHQTHDPSSLGKLQVVRDTFFPAPHSKQAGISPVYWTCPSDGSPVMQRGTFMASSSSTSQLRSALYFSPSLS